MLTVEDLAARYGAIRALHHVSLHVDRGEVVALIGPNGAGKTTLLGCIGGLVKPAAGRIRLDDRDVTRWTPHRMIAAGVSLVPEHRRIFRDLTVEENLLLGGVTKRPAVRRARADEMMERFPVLGIKRVTQAGFLSGGEAQQLAIARALMCEPRVLLMDEPALGLAPTLVDLVMRLISDLRADGTTVLVVEQNAAKVLAVADRAYVLRTGEVVQEGSGDDLLAQADLFASYLGVARS